MEREALLLRLRAEQAKLAAQYADEAERPIYEQRARAYEAQAIETGWTSGPRRKVPPGRVGVPIGRVLGCRACSGHSLRR